MTINLEMLKQLLQEFAVRETLTTEEIKAVDQQSAELKLRIEECRVRLQAISEDKQRIEEMRRRYREAAGVGNGVSVNSTAVAGAASGAVYSVTNLDQKSGADQGALPQAELVAATAIGKSTAVTAELVAEAAIAPKVDDDPLSELGFFAETNAVNGVEPVTAAASTSGKVVSEPKQEELAWMERQLNQAAEAAKAADGASQPEVAKLESAGAQFFDDIPVNQFAESTSSGQIDAVTDNRATAKPAQSAEPLAESEEPADETVKSINDALRGLFR
jgi:hypothetical protein